MAKRRVIKEDKVPVKKRKIVSASGNGENNLSDIRESIISNVKNKLKSDDYIMTLGMNKHLAKVRSWVKTELITLDWLLSDWEGLPVGKAIHFWGKEASGKSAFAQYMIPRYQKAKGLVVYIDFEHSLDEDFITGYGGNINDILYAQPDTIEQGWDIFWTILKGTKGTGLPVLIIWDSVAAGTPKAEFEEKSSDKAHVGLVARSMSKGARRLRRQIAKHDCTVLFVNQLRDKIGVTFGEKTAPPAGHALRFASDIMMKFDKIKTLYRGSEERKRAVGYIIRVTNKKNRLAIPHRRSEFVLSFKTGIDVNLTLVHEFKRLGIMRPAGKLRKVKGLDETFKEKNFLEFFKENKKHCMSLLKDRLDYDDDE